MRDLQHSELDLVTGAVAEGGCIVLPPMLLPPPLPFPFPSPAEEQEVR